MDSTKQTFAVDGLAELGAKDLTRTNGGLGPLAIALVGAGAGVAGNWLLNRGNRRTTNNHYYGSRCPTRRRR